MPMELRKRKAPVNPPPPAPAKKSKVAEAKKKSIAKAKEAVAPAKKAPGRKKAEKASVEKKDEGASGPVPAEKASESEAKPEAKTEAKPEAPAEPAAGASNSAPAPAPAKKGRGKAKDKEPAADAKAEAKTVPKLKVGDTLPSDIGEVTLDDGSKITLGALLDSSEKGIVIFSYTKQNTPGCTTQACSFRDNYAAFTSAGYLVYGMSGDSHTDNAKFKSKQNLGFPLISDPGFSVHEKLGIKATTPKVGTVRSVIVIQKEGAAIKEHKTASPKNSLEIAKKACGIDGAAAPVAKTEAESTTKTVTVGSGAPTASAEGEAAKPAESS